MAGTRISDGTPTSITGAEKVPMGTGSGKTTTTTQAIADLARVSTLNGLGTGIATWLATPSWTNFNSAITGTAPYWALSSGGTLTAANTITGTSTNILKFSFANLGTTVTDGAGLWFSNSTAAAAGLQQISPIITLEGQGWKTNATAASQQTLWEIYNLPVQGSGNPTTNLIFQSSVNGVATNGKLTLSSDGARLVSFANGLQIQTNAAAVGGISLNGSQPSSNTITTTFPGFAITSGSNWNSAGTGILLTGGSTINPTSGAIINVGISGSFIPTSGTATFTSLSITNTINQTGGANGAITYLDINPTRTAVVGNEYGILSRFGMNAFGLGATLPTNALIVIGAGTTSLAPLKLTSGTNLTTAVAGCMEYDGTTLFYTRTGTTRESILTGIANVVSPTSPNRTIQVVVNGTTLFIAAKTTND